MRVERKKGIKGTMRGEEGKTRHHQVRHSQKRRLSQNLPEKDKNGNDKIWHENKIK